MKPRKNSEAKIPSDLIELNYSDAIKIEENKDWKSLKELKQEDKTLVISSNDDYFIYRSQENGSRFVYFDYFETPRIERVLKDSRRFENSKLIINFNKEGFDPSLSKDLTPEQWVIKCVSKEIEMMNKIDGFNHIIALEYSDEYDFNSVVRVLLTIYDYSIAVIINENDYPKIDSLIEEKLLNIVIKK